MLNIRVKEFEGIDIQSLKTISTDMEKEFRKIKLSGTDVDRKIIESIDRGEYLDAWKFQNELGVTLMTEYLSTGCKAALVVAHNPDKEFDITECGRGAVDCIVNYLTDGNIVIPSASIGFSAVDFIVDKSGIVIVDNPIDVGINGFRITSIDRLNEYVLYEFPFWPELGDPDISEIPGAKHYGAWWKYSEMGLSEEDLESVKSERIASMVDKIEFTEF